MKHYNYKITNIETGEFYVGVRSCKCEIEDDKYMGSSSIWTKAYIKEHKDVLKKEIEEKNYKTLISVDGGVNEENISILKEKNVDILVSSSYLLSGEINNKISLMRN